MQRRLESGVADLHGVRSVSANIRTGRVLITYHPDTLLEDLAPGARVQLGDGAISMRNVTFAARAVPPFLTRPVTRSPVTKRLPGTSVVKSMGSSWSWPRPE
mgnify:CR=1 FL=1